MTLTCDQENAKMLAALLGIEEDEAAQRLKLRIAINFDPADAAAQELAAHIAAMLGRTVEYAGVPDQNACAVEIVIGPRAAVTNAAARVYAGEDGRDFVIREDAPLPQSYLSTPRPLLVIAACYVAATAIGVALGASFPVSGAGPIVLAWEQLLGSHLNRLNTPLDIGETYLAGAGAVGNGFMYTLRYFDVRGTLYITDPKKVTPGGLNRCLLFGIDDLGHPKATRLCEAAKPHFPR